MKALIAFIVMVLVILTLIEINERFKAKRKKPSNSSSQIANNCPTTACAECDLAKQCPSQSANGRKNHSDNENLNTSV